MQQQWLSEHLRSLLAQLMTQQNTVQVHDSLHLTHLLAATDTMKQSSALLQNTSTPLPLTHYGREKLVDAGFESGHAYGKALRTVKSCVGSTWCRYGMSDAIGVAVRLENRYKGALRAFWEPKLLKVLDRCDDSEE